MFAIGRGPEQIHSLDDCLPFAFRDQDSIAFLRRDKDRRAVSIYLFNQRKELSTSLRGGDNHEELPN